MKSIMIAIFGIYLATNAFAGQTVTTRGVGSANLGESESLRLTIQHATENAEADALQKAKDACGGKANQLGSSEILQEFRKGQDEVVVVSAEFECL